MAALRTHGPMTRYELDTHLDVQSSSIHLPRMVEDGLLVVQKVPSPIPHPKGGLRRNRYHLAQDQRAVNAGHGGLMDP